MSILIGEFIGTLILLLLGNGCVANVLLSKSKGEKGGWIVISAGWGFAVLMGVFAVGWISGAHLNPAVTLGFWIVGKTAISDIPLYLIGQFLGAMAGAWLVWAAYFPHWAATESQRLKLLCFCTSPEIRNPTSNFATEVIATAVLLMGILGIFNSHNGIDNAMAPYAVGLLIFSIGLSLGGPTGFAINPARDLGPRLIHAWISIPNKGSSEWDYAWIPIFGPLLGALLGTILYLVLIAPL